MPSSTENQTRLVIWIAALVVAGAIFALAVMLMTRPMPSDMPDMKHAAATVAKSTPSPTMSGDMPGMDHGPAATESPWKTHDHGSADSPGKAHDDGAADSPWKTPAHEHGTPVEVVPDQPLAAVLGIFGVGTGGVMLSAGILRHRDRARNRITSAARAARRSQT